MYTSFVGKKFLRLFNERKKKQITARQFFDDEFFPVFFKDEPHLLHVGNSPFFQGLSAKDLSSGKNQADVRLENLHANIRDKQPNGSIFVGYAAEDLKGTTSGQVTNMPLIIDDEEIYASWIGEALAVGIAGGVYLLFDRDDILWDVFEGWQLYRKYLQQTPTVKGRQIETWNGRWLYYALGDRDEAFVAPEPEKAGEGKELSIKGLPWVQLIFELSRQYPSSSLTVYAYSLGQTNTTLGFINLKLHEVTRLWEYKKVIFGVNEGVRKIEELYEPLMTFRMACQSGGAIGIQSVEPIKLREYFPQYDAKKNKDYKLNTENAIFYFKLYKLWIIAMLNKKELLELASKMADSLLLIERKENQRGKSVTSNLSEEVRGAKNVREFIEKLREVMEKDNSLNQTLHDVMEQVLTMPHDNFPLFVTLIRFEYSYKKTPLVQQILRLEA